MSAAIRPGMLSCSPGLEGCAAPALPRHGRSSVLGSWLVALAMALPACSDGASSRGGVAGSASAVAPATTPSAAIAAGPAARKSFAPSHAGCDAVPVFVAGAQAGSVCADEAHANGLTVLDLSDEWTPLVFAPDPETHDAPSYRAKYLELANQPNADLGLYGIAPSLTVLAARLTDEKRRACDALVDLAPIAALHETWLSAPDEKSASAVLKNPSAKTAIRSAQNELVCAGILKAGSANGSLGGSTQIALDAFRRRHMVVGSALDGGTLAALALGGDELDFRALLRGLRERVADASGLIEDGSASEDRALVVGREIDLSRFAPAPHEALEGGAPDLVDAATDVAARELGLTSPDAARAFLVARGNDGVKSFRVAVTLPAAPSYQSNAMNLRVEIDRGDVFYDYPGQAAVAKKKLGTVRGPSFVVYAKDGEKERALVRWATTIGGWKKERTDEGEIALKYKESDVGERVWRQIIAAPAWMPPDSTPETDLLHEGKDGSFALKRDLIQPGFRNAYGLVMLIHDEVVTHGSETTYVDHGIRTHGSVDYRSIQRGESHGCHRLYNQLALRLSGYLLEHRNHVRRGKMRVAYHRTLEWNEQTVEVDVPERGYLYELDPPVPVRVLEGHVAGDAQKPVSSLIHLKTDEPSKG